MHRNHLGYVANTEGLSEEQKAKLTLNIYRKLLKRYAITKEAEKVINDILRFYESIEDYEVCSEIVNMIKENKMTFELD